jgi:large subunit ribosomal protein L29
MSKQATTLTQLRDLPNEELHQALARTRDELFRLNLGQYTNQVTSTAALTTKRRDVARILTILRARELGHETQAAKTGTGDEATAAERKSKPKAKKAAAAAKPTTKKKAKS